MDIAGEGDCAIMTWDGLVHWGISGLSVRSSGLGDKSSRGGRGGGFTGSGAFPISSGGEALGKMTGGLVTGSSLWDMICGVSKEG